MPVVNYNVEISGIPIENPEMEKVISDHLTKKKISIDEKTLKEVTMAVMKHIYKLNMEVQ